MSDICSTTLDLEPDTSSLPLPLAPSRLYEIRKTPTSGRGVFATTFIPAGTLVLDTSTPFPRAAASAATTANASFISTPSPPGTVHLSPTAYLIQRPYRKEVCGWCFHYDRGREFKLKVVGNDCGVVFCGPDCRQAWLDWHGDVGVEARAALEAAAKASMTKLRNGSTTTDHDEVEDVQMWDVASSESDDDNDNNDQIGDVVSAPPQKHRPPRGPTMSEIEEAWAQAATHGEAILRVRASKTMETTDTNTDTSHLCRPPPTKSDHRTMQTIAQQRIGDPDLMSYILSATIAAWNADGRPVTNTSSSRSSITSLISPLFALTSTISAYQAHHTSLRLYIASYLSLLTFLPMILLPYTIPQLCHALNVHAAHNAFSLRPVGLTDGLNSGEFLGWAVFPSASFFNHSCRPNLKKERIGRKFVFWAARDIESGEELGISYLGGEEEDLKTRERRGRLKREWGFKCRCVRCTTEEEEERRRQTVILS